MDRVGEPWTDVVGRSECGSWRGVGVSWLWLLFWVGVLRPGIRIIRRISCRCRLGWLLVRRLGLVGEVPPGFDRVRSCKRGLMGPAVLLTLGFQFLLDSMGVIRFGRTLPLLLVVIGLVKIFQSTAGPGPLAGPPSAIPSGAPPYANGEVPPPYTEVKPEVKNG